MPGYLRTLDGREYSIGTVQTRIDCFRCGFCCTDFRVKLTIDDLNRIIEGLGVSNEDLYRRYVEITAAGYMLRQTEKGCVFLTWEDDGTQTSCRIYPFRPEACRNWVPSLSRRECQEGLRKLRTSGKLLLPTEMYLSRAEIEKLCSLLKNDAATLWK